MQPDRSLRRVVLALGLLWSTTVHADPQTTLFSGTIEFVDDPFFLLDPSVQAGSPFHGRITLDPDAVTSTQDIGIGITYGSDIGDIEARVESSDYAQSVDSIVVGDDRDLTSFGPGLEVADIWSTIESDFGVFIGLAYLDESGAKLNDEALFVDPTPAGWSETRFAIFLAEPLPNGTSILARGSITGPNLTLDATKSDQLELDLENPGVADPGDELRYTIVISNPDPTDVDGIAFHDALDPDTTLVVGSVTTSQGVVLAGNTGGDTDVAVDVGLLTGPGGMGSSSVTIEYVVSVNDPFPSERLSVQNQGWVTTENGLVPASQGPTDDPDTAAPDDATTTFVPEPSGTLPLVLGMLQLAVLARSRRRA